MKNRELLIVSIHTIRAKSFLKFIPVIQISNYFQFFKNEISKEGYLGVTPLGSPKPKLMLKNGRNSTFSTLIAPWEFLGLFRKSLVYFMENCHSGNCWKNCYLKYIKLGREPKLRFKPKFWKKHFVRNRKFLIFRIFCLASFF